LGNDDDVYSAGVITREPEKSEFDFHLGTNDQPNLSEGIELYDPYDSAFWAVKATNEDLNLRHATKPTINFNSFKASTSFANPPSLLMWSNNPPSYPTIQPGPSPNSYPMPIIDDIEKLPDDGLAIFLPQMEGSPPPSSPKPLLSSRHNPGYTHEMLKGFDAVDVSDEGAGTKKRDREDDQGLDGSGRPSKAAKASN
jgi:hypothetical protein